MIHEYVQYAVWKGLACRCRCFWSEVIQACVFQEYVDLMGRGRLRIQTELPDDIAITEIEIMIREEDSFSLLKKASSFYLTVSPAQIVQTEIIQCLLIDIFQYELKKRGLLSFHSGACRYNGQTLLIAGETGAGKTTILLEGQRRINGFETLSNDYVVVRPGKTAELMFGDEASSISIRKDIAGWHDKNEKASEYLGSENRQYIEWTSHDIAEPLPVKAILFPELTDSCDQLIVRFMSQDESFYRLYYSTIALDSGIQLMLFDTDGAFLCETPYLLNKEIVDKIRRQIQTLITYTPVIRIIGSIEQILFYISRF